MIYHCVLFRWKDDVSADRVAVVSAGLDRVAKLDSVESYAHGRDVGISDGNFDYGIVATFASVEDYEAYATEESHLAFIAETVPVIEARSAVQLEIG